MANTFRIKRRVIGPAGAPSTLKNAELAFNEVDSTLYYGKGNDGSNNATVVLPIAGGPELSALSVLATTGLMARTSSGSYTTRALVGAAGRLSVTDGDGVSANPSFDLETSGIVAGTYIKVTFDAYGRATGFSAFTSSDVTTALNFTPEDSANKGVANGYASLDSLGRVPTDQLPDTVTGGLNYHGTWDSSTNTPTLVSGTGSKGYYYKVSVAGTTNLDGMNSWSIGDSVVFNGSTWDRLKGSSSEVVSVAGKIGVITLVPADVVGLGTLATQDSSSVNITGGTVAGSTITGDITTKSENVTGIVPVTNGGTGTTNLTGYVRGNGASTLTAQPSIPTTDITGLGTMSFQSASYVAITGGTIDNVTVDGGTF